MIRKLQPDGESRFKSVSGLRVRVRIVVDVTVEWGFQGLADLFVALANAIAVTVTTFKEFAMSVFNDIVCVGAALMPAWWETPLHKWHGHIKNTSSFR
jgi:hypothetical protein